jgi:membrane fusion protein (multidrug efflux system)
VVASGVAEVRPQVAGIITERLFEEGSFVTQGDELYRIDPASYEAQVAAATAAVAQAEATLSSAQKESDRMQALLERRVVSQQNLDDANAIRDAAAAALQVAQAQLLAANIDLDRTTIRAPLTGEVGRSLTTRGALVTAGQAGALAVIRQLDPVYVDVTQSAAELIRWRRGETQAELGSANRTVVLTLADGEPYEFTGELTAAEPHVDEQTGVVVLRLEFPNPDELLLPGMYVQVEMPQGVIANAVLAPQDGVTRDRRGRPIALVVNEQNVIEERTLTVVRNIGSDWIVSAGLEDGDRIIVEGLQKVGVGMTVVPEERQPTQTQTEN